MNLRVPSIPTPNIDLLFADGTQVTIPVLSQVRGLTNNGKRPIGFYYEPNQPTYGISRQAFLEWMHTEFIYIFDKDSQLFQTHLSIIDYKD